MQELVIRLPWPPSINQLWRMGKGNWYATKVGLEFKELVKYFVFKAKSPRFSEFANLSFQLLAYPPDNRRRDLDNLCKICCDSLQDANVYANDCQIKKINMEMKEKDPEKKGYVLITIGILE